MIWMRLCWCARNDVIQKETNWFSRFACWMWFCVGWCVASTYTYSYRCSFRQQLSVRLNTLWAFPFVGNFIVKKLNSNMICICGRSATYRHNAMAKPVWAAFSFNIIFLIHVRWINDATYLWRQVRGAFVRMTSVRVCTLNEDSNGYCLRLMRSYLCKSIRRDFSTFAVAQRCRTESMFRKSDFMLCSCITFLFFFFFWLSIAYCSW